MTIDWEQKVIALLHDPPDKQLDRKGHEERARRLLDLALEKSVDDKHPAWKQAEWADRVAAASDRIAFPYISRTRRAEHVVQSIKITHMLSGRVVELQGAGKADRQAQERALRTLLAEVGKNGRLRYLALWRSMLDQIVHEDASGLGQGWRWLPADSRQPDHTLVEHLDTTAAFSMALPDPALLTFAIGPVQSYISAARRTQDLWVGSYLLAYLTWCAIQEIAQAAGPDAILYPSLRGHPLADLWLKSEGLALDEPALVALQQASLPNTFTALVPAARAAALAAWAEAAVMKARDEIAAAVLAEFPGPAPNGVWLQIWDRQIKDWPQVYWSIYPWPTHIPAEEKSRVAREIGVDVHHLKRSDEAYAWQVRQIYEEIAQPASDDDWWRVFNERFDHYWGTTEAHPLRSEINAGSVYVLLHDLARRGLDARKMARTFGQIYEDGEKCTVCGERSALRWADGDRQQLRKDWSLVAKALQMANRHTEVRPEGAERLCALCAIKRFAQRAYLEDAVGLKGTFPSTRYVAAATFWEAVIGAEAPNLWAALENLNQRLRRAGIPKTSAEHAIPRLNRLVADLADPWRKEQVTRLLRFDPELLMPETYADFDVFRSEWSVDANDQDMAHLQGAASAVLEAARKAGIAPPSRYYAILMLDGDRIGAWLSGDRGPSLAQVLHPGTRKQLEQDAAWQPLLSMTRTVSPAHHAAISSALSTYARRIVPMIVEQWHAGRLVYAGGDDVLALLPVSEALNVARELRFFFSGEVNLLTPREGVREVPDTDGKPSGYIEMSGEWLVTMGPLATASAGLAIAHCMAPLGDILEEARRAEAIAKEYGGQDRRDALVVRFLKRAGAPREMATKWRYPALAQDPVAIVDELCARFAEMDQTQSHLSRRLPYVLRVEADALGALPQEAVEAELDRLLTRHGEWSDARERRALVETLSTWSECLRPIAREGSPLTIVADWLILARFIASGGGDAE
ncbi:MAG: type III-B CRISPR-associated protein Cas10/Cmr2 [Anaerolineae bacterium]